MTTETESPLAMELLALSSEIIDAVDDMASLERLRPILTRIGALAAKISVSEFLGRQDQADTAHDAAHAERIAGLNAEAEARVER